jgi:hypothetical protein
LNFVFQNSTSGLSVDESKKICNISRDVSTVVPLATTMSRVFLGPTSKKVSMCFLRPMLLQLALPQTQLILGYSIQSQRFCHRFSTRIELPWNWLTLPPIQSHLAIFHGCSRPFLQSMCFSSSLADRLVYEPSGTAKKLIKLCSVRMAAHANSRYFSPCPQLLPQWKWTPINTKTS